MRYVILTLLTLLLLSVVTGQTIDPAHEWSLMSTDQRDVVWYAYKWGLSRDYREMGAHYAVESRGNMSAIRYESSTDPTKICAGPGQNNVRFSANRTFSKHITVEQFDLTLRRLRTDIDYSLEQSYAHIKIGLGRYKYRWNVWKWYNSINVESEMYPVKVQAWLLFLDSIYEE